ncbi:hypothetical protein ACSZNV_08355 [Aeromonas hydrophila]|uniref:hypothetical protein n=1 Tax=Aeromonas hydrophila TaxID=644 RepID=UPI001CC7D93B|nr:hypothetical protein [Aeromonas hydrophila]
MSEDKCNRFKTREWWMLIVLIIVIQWMVHFWSTKAMSSNEMVSYVSFAGTLVSTILAVLAIIYSFIQSASQQTSSEIISREVHKLHEIVKEVNLSTERVNVSLGKIPNLIVQVEKLPAIIERSIVTGVDPIKEQNVTLLDMFKELTVSQGKNTNAELESDIQEDDPVDKSNPKLISRSSMLYISFLGHGLGAKAIKNNMSLYVLYNKRLSGLSLDESIYLNCLFSAAVSFTADGFRRDVIDGAVLSNFERHKNCNDDSWSGYNEMLDDTIKQIIDMVADESISSSAPKFLVEFMMEILEMKVSD